MRADRAASSGFVMAKPEQQSKEEGNQHPAFLRGTKLYQHGDLEGARDAMLEAISEDFENAPAWAMLSNIYADMDEPEHAAEAARQAVRSELDNPEWRVLRALQVQLISRFDEAKAEFAKAIELDAGYVSAWLNRALLLAKLGEDQAALSDLNQAVKLNPSAWLMIDHYEEFDRLKEAEGFPAEPAGLGDDLEANPDNPFLALKLPQDDAE